MDVLPAVATLCGAPLPANLLDGINIWPLLTGAQAAMTRDVLLYFEAWHLQCARLSTWKLHVARPNCLPWGPAPESGRINLPLRKPELYRLDADPGERCDVADENPAVVSEIMARIQALLSTLPTEVINDWNYTMSLKVRPTPIGALPVAQ
jgi:arylsulfatase